MSALQTRTKDAIVATIAAAMQGRVATFLNFSVGSVFLAIAEAQAGVALWLQGEIGKVLALTRAATSNGEDLDSFMADYDLTRQAAVPATGSVTFTRFTAGPAQIIVPVGAVVQTGDGSQRFVVYADSQIGTYSGVDGGYRIYPGVGSVTAPVQAQTAGTTGNISAGAITLAASSIPGVDNVTNLAGFTNGVDAESDASFRLRFKAFFNSLSKGTEGAIAYALTGLGQNIRYKILSNYQVDGSFVPGTVTVVVDDGSGNPPDALILKALDAVNQVRAAGVRVAVIGATSLSATIQMTLEYGAGYYPPDVVAKVVGAITAYVNGLGLGEKLPRSRLEQIAYNASPGVTNVTNVLINNARIDLVPSPRQTVDLALAVVS
jgi:uncharacterized phage protein gp47/JayE